MAFYKFADCKVATPIINVNSWFQNRIAKISPIGYDIEAKFEKANKIILNSFPAKDYLFSHATIMSSLSVDDNVEYYITPKTSKMLNANGDGWETKLLKIAYSTFRGAYNYLEHHQVPADKKGWVVDAISREVEIEGEKPVIYIDLLVATEKKHEDLIARIESGQLNSMSMGCKVSYTYCSKCGNKAKDEVDLCEHIRYQKGNTFYDENGVQRVIGELCGHYSDPSSVEFIEASWVADPAFKGAVKRNFIPIISNVSIPKKANKFDEISCDLIKVAKNLQKMAQEEEKQDDLEKKQEEAIDTELDTDLEDKKDIADEFWIDTINMDSNIIKKDDLHKLSNRFSNKNAFIDVLKNVDNFKWKDISSNFNKSELLAISFIKNALFCNTTFFNLYPIIKKAGGLKKYSNKDDFFKHCEKLLNRKLSFNEKKFLLIQSKIFDLGGNNE